MVQPSDVFNIRRGDVNAEMYVERPRLEAALQQGLRSGLHLVIKGESGCGKSWLYKKVFRDGNVFYRTVNMASALASRSITDTAVQCVMGGVSQLEEVEKRSAFALLLQAFGLSRETARRFRQIHNEPFLACVRAMRAQAGKRDALIVFENLEQIAHDSDLLRQVAACLMYLDDETYSREKVRICIVGTHTNVVELISHAGNAPVRNRVHEVPEVMRLTDEEADTLVMRGFVEMLGYARPEIEAVLDDIVWMADRIPQHLHALCFYFADLLDHRGREIETDVLVEACLNWLESQEAGSYAAITSHMTFSRDAVGRKNQLLYSLGQVDQIDFTARDLEDVFRTEFPNTTADKGLNVAGMLSDFASGDSPVVRRSPVGQSLYRFANPILRIALRIMLVKDERERVSAISSEELASKLGSLGLREEAKTAQAPSGRMPTAGAGRRRLQQSSGASRRRARRLADRAKLGRDRPQ